MNQINKNSISLTNEVKDLFSDILNGKYVFESPEGIPIVLSLNDDLLLAKRFSNKIRAEFDWFEKLISHQPSVGYFYENILKNTLKDFLPSRYKIGTGFIYNFNTKNHSKQIDILIYTDENEAPLYKNGDFIIVTPENSISLIEVKKTLRKQDISDIIKKTLSFYSGTFNYNESYVQYINIFAYNSKVTIRNIAKEVIKQINLLISRFMIKNNSNKIGVLRGIVLPQFFILNEKDNFFITSSLSSGKNYEYKVKISIIKSFSNDILGDFFSHLIPEKISFQEIVTNKSNGLTNAIYEPIDEYNSDVSFSLYSFVPIIELARKYPDDIGKIKKLLISKNNTLNGLLIPDINWKIIPNFDKLINIKNIIYVSNRRGFENIKQD